MMERLRAGISSVFRRKPVKKHDPVQKIPLRGNAHNVIVVKAPNDLFSEAIFILRDEYLASPTDAKAELLRQAKESAAGYAASVSVSAGVSRAILILLTVLLALETLGVFLLLG